MRQLTGYKRKRFCADLLFCKLESFELTQGRGAKFYRKQKVSFWETLCKIWHPLPKVLKLRNLIADYSAQDLERDRRAGLFREHSAQNYIKNLP